MSKGVLVSVCVCTFRRPVEIARLLEALARQERVPGGWEVIVVDNDRHRSASSALREVARLSPHLCLRDFVEPVQGIARARNRAVREALGRWIAFIDDDEVPSLTWLSALLEAAVAYGVDGVLGPVQSDISFDSPLWIRRGSFFDRPRHPTGAPVPEGELRTGNLLITRDCLSRVDGPFNESFNLSGGEDWALLRQLKRLGAKFVWCDSALVTEHVTRERLRLVALLRRASSSGEVYGRTRIATEGWRGRMETLLHGLVSMIVGIAGALLLTVFGKHLGARFLMRTAGGFGRLLALTPIRQERYRFTLS